MHSERYKLGWQKLAQIDGEQGEKVIRAMEGIAPDFARLLIEFPFGDIYSREALDLQSREIATIAALAAMGNAAPQLRVHIHGALNVGCSPQEVIEVMMQMAVYAGFPAALNGLFAVQEVLKERDLEPNSVDKSDTISLSSISSGRFTTAELRITDSQRIDETKAAILELCHQTRNESGCYLFEVHECTDEPTQLLLWECFATEADFHKHHAMDYTKAYMQRGLTEVVRLHHSHLMC